MANGGFQAGWLFASRMIAFWAGIVGIAYETVYEEADRPWLFLVFLTMMGLAQFGKVFQTLGRDNGVTITLGRRRGPPGPGPAPGGPGKEGSVP